MGLMKTIDFIVGNPNRSRAWKRFDVALLVLLWSASIASALMWLATGQWSIWFVVVRVVAPITVLATARSWYRHPRYSRHARERIANGDARPSVSTSRADPSYGYVSATEGDLSVRRDVTSPSEVQVFRTRAVALSGWADAVLGAILVGVALSVSLTKDRPASFAIGISIAVVASIIGGAGVARITAHLEVHTTKLVWTWAFSRHEVTLAELVDAALVEPGSPQGGGAIGGFIAGGLLAVACWWLLELAGSMYEAGPTLGSHTLVVVRKYGAPIRISPIGTFARHPEVSGAAAAESSVRAAITSFHAHFEQHRRSS
jgi:hypothetical protein